MATINRTAEKTAYSRFTAAGMTPQGACGLIGNLEAESDGFYPNRLEYLCVKRLKENGKTYTDETYTASIDSGKISCEEFLHPLPGKQYGYGLAQWTTPARKSGLWNLAHQRGVSIADLDMQLDYILRELEEKFPSVLKVLKTVGSIQEASDIVLMKFEAPSNAEQLKASRAERGKKFYEYMKGENHMISNCGHDENGKYTGGTAGDQTGGEWAIIPWYNRPWNCVIRHPDRSVGNTLAELARKAAQNNLIGYDQNQRGTYWQHLKASNYDPAQITIACEADCSSGVAANVKAAGYRLGRKELQSVSADCYTGNLRAALKAAGFDVYTSSKYLISPDYLLPGDILLYEGHHTATNLDTGSKVTSSTSSAGGTEISTIPTPVTGNVSKGQKWLNTNYPDIVKSATGSLLAIDDSYGPHSRWAALAIWKDVVNRKYGYSLTPSNQNFGSSCKAAAKKAQIQNGSSVTLVYIAEFILSAKGFYTGKMDADFGSGLKASTMAFQEAVGLPTDGIIGPDTWYALFN